MLTNEVRRGSPRELAHLPKTEASSCRDGTRIQEHAAYGSARWVVVGREAPA